MGRRSLSDLAILGFDSSYAFGSKEEVRPIHHLVGAAAGLENVINLSDALFFGMVVPNLIGLYVLLPVVKRELAAFQEHAAEVDAKTKDS